MSSNDPKDTSSNKGPQPKLKAPPPRRNANAQRDQAADELLTGPTVRTRPQRIKEEDSQPQQILHSAFSAPTREVKPSTRQISGTSSGATVAPPSRSAAAAAAVVGFSTMMDDDSAIKYEHSGELHYSPVTVPFQPPSNSLTSAWYQQFQGRVNEEQLLGLSPLMSSTTPSPQHAFPLPELPAYRDPSYAAAIDPTINSIAQNPTSAPSPSTTTTALIKEEVLSPSTPIDTQHRGVYDGLPSTQNPYGEEYMVPVLHSAAQAVAFKHISSTSQTAIKTEQSTDSTTSTTPNANQLDQQLDQTAINSNLSFIQLPPILHLSQTEPTVRGASTVDGVYYREGLPISFNVNGGTSKTEDAAKLGLLPRTRDLSYSGRIGELEIYESGTVYLVIGDQRLLLQKGPEVMMRQDLVHLRRHPFNLTPAPTNTSSATTPAGAATAASSGVELSVTTTIDDSYVLYRMGHVNNHLIASIDVANMIHNAQQ